MFLRRKTYLLWVVVFCVTLAAGSLQARIAYAQTPAEGQSSSGLSEEQKRVFEMDISDFDLENIPTECAISAESGVTGNDNEEKIFNFLRKKGLTAEQAAGIVGNFAVESSFNPFAQEGGKTPPKGGYGIAQWTGTGESGDPAGSRRLDMIKAMKDKGMRVDLNAQTVDNKVDEDTLLAAQLNYMWNEAYTRGDIAKIKNETTVRGAVISWLENFERAGISHEERRIEAGTSAIQRFGSGSTQTPDDSSDSIACEAREGTGEVVAGEYSLPVPKKFFDSNPTWFTKPHHNYPAADIPVASGTKIFAVAAGTVTDMSNTSNDGRGVYVQISDSNVVYKYFHGTPGSISSKVRIGAKVKAGQQLMISDNTGNSDGPHLHFQIDINGVKHCPQKLLEAIGKGTEVPEPASLPRSGCTY